MFQLFSNILDRQFSSVRLFAISGVLFMGANLQCSAQATFNGDIPYAKSLTNADSSLKVWTMTRIKQDKDDTINPGGNTTKEKDIRSNSLLLGYPSLKANEIKNFKGQLDLTKAIIPSKIAILVDDVATLTVTEIERDDGVEGDIFKHVFKVNGTALWNPRSYKDFATMLPVGRKYQLDLKYENRAHLTTQYGGKVDVDGVSVYVSTLPVEVEELSPRLRDEDDIEIADSEKPAVAPNSTEMVERDPSANPRPLNNASAIRVAWRDMKVKISEDLEGKIVTWSMTPTFTPLQVNGNPEAAPRFRGIWGTAQAAIHRHKFSASEVYGVHNFASITDFAEPLTNATVTATAQTTVDADGYTAIRVNLPPIGFNKAQITISIEDVEGEIDLIELEVPAVIVIDPGHGSGRRVGGSAVGSIGLHSNVAEGDAALDIGTRVLAEISRLREDRGLLVKKYSTKLSNNPRLNIGLNDREAKAREFGADSFISLHFDGATNDPNSKAALYRNPFGMIDQDDTLWNRNPRADWALAIRIRIAVQRAITAIEPAESLQDTIDAYDAWDATHNPNAERLTSEINESRLQKGLGALNDGGNSGQQNGNYRAGVVRYTPCRMTLIELERTANEQADTLFSGNTAYNATTGAITLTPLADSMRARVATEIAAASIDDVLVRDLANRADVPLRVDRRPRVPRLDFE